MKQLTKQEFKILYHISRGRNNTQRLESLFSKKDILKTITKLEKVGLIKISYLNEEIYGFMETPLGNNILNDPEFKSWFEECGD